MNESTQAFGLSSLIQRLKEDLFTEISQDQPKLFFIDEVTVEVNIVATRDASGGINLGVATLGAKLAGEQIQKVTIKMTPLMTKQELITGLNRDPNFKKEKKVANKVLLRGDES